uniref:hypothetical protein n=1 Tax=Acinetobacter baumannii TaxID=470 RepID=UPI001C074610
HSVYAVVAIDRKRANVLCVCVQMFSPCLISGIPTWSTNKKLWANINIDYGALDTCANITGQVDVANLIPPGYARLLLVLD